MLKITKGEWSVFETDAGLVWVDNDCGENICDMYHKKNSNDFYKKPNAKENADLIAEAGTVANETGLTPRQLLEQRDELLESLKKYKFAVDQMNEAMKDGGNVQGAIGMLIAAEEDVEMAIAKAEGK